MKNQFYRIWSYYLSLECKFYTYLKIQTSQKYKYMSQYAVGYPSIIKWLITRGKDMTAPIRTHPNLVWKLWVFHKEYLQRIIHKRNLNDLHSYKNIFGQRSLVLHKQWFLKVTQYTYGEINATEILLNLYYKAV